MKTTIEISDELLRRAKQVALERNTTLRAIVEEALERTLGPAGDVAPLRTVTWGGTGRGKGVDSKRIGRALARERQGSAEDAEYWRKRFGFVPPGVRQR